MYFLFKILYNKIIDNVVIKSGGRNDKTCN